MASQSLEYARKFRSHRRRIIFCSGHMGNRPLAPPIYRRLLPASTFRDSVPKCNDKGRASCPGVCHPMEEVATPHSGEAPGEMGMEQVGSRLVHNFSDMNESCDSRSSSRTTPVRSIPLRTKSKWRLRNGCNLRLRPGHIASPYLQNQIRLCRRVSYAFGFQPLESSLPCVICSGKINLKVQRSL
jgi:hypothetical protein